MEISLSENTNIAHSGRCVLTIYVRPEQFSFSIYNPAKTDSYFYGEIPRENQTDALSAFKEAFSDNNFFALPYRKIQVVNYTPFFTYVPRSFYDDKNKGNFMKFLFSESGRITLDHPIPSAEIILLHQMPEITYDFLSQSFVNPQFIHHSAPLLAYFSKRSRTLNVCRMIVTIHETGLDILCFSRKKFLLGNYFSCHRRSDMVYYVLFIWKQLKFNQLEDVLYLIGSPALREELSGALAPYLQEIVSLDSLPEFRFTGVAADEIPFELRALSVCEL